MAGGERRHHLLFQYGMDGEFRDRADRRADEGGVDPLGTQPVNQLTRAGLLQGQRDQRARLAEFADHPRHKGVKRRRAGKAEPDPAGVAAGGAARRDDGMLDAIEDRACFGQQRFARLGQLDAARLAPEQLHFELGFERADLLAQWRLLDAESFRRAGDMPLLGDGDEITEVPQFHLRYSDNMDRASVIYWTGAISATTFPSESRHQPRRRSAMATEAKLLTVQFLKWMAERPRSYAEVRAAWSST